MQDVQITVLPEYKRGILPIQNKEDPLTVRLLIQLQGRRSTAAVARPVDLVLALDRSDSMQLPMTKSIEQTRIQMVQRVAKAVASLLRPGIDRLGVVTFGLHAKICAELGSVQSQATRMALNQLCDTDYSDHLDGMTNIGEALSESFARFPLLAETPGRARMVLLVTDGDPTVGDDTLESLAKRFRAQDDPLYGGLPDDCVLHTLGIGEQHKVELLQELAALGHGQYFAIHEEEHMVKAFAATLGSVVVHPVVKDLTLFLDSLYNVGQVRLTAVHGLQVQVNKDMFDIPKSVTWATPLYSGQERSLLLEMAIHPGALRHAIRPVTLWLYLGEAAALRLDCPEIRFAGAAETTERDPAVVKVKQDLCVERVLQLIENPDPLEQLADAMMQEQRQDLAAHLLHTASQLRASPKTASYHSAQVLSCMAQREWSDSQVEFHEGLVEAMAHPVSHGKRPREEAGGEESPTKKQRPQPPVALQEEEQEEMDFIAETMSGLANDNMDVEQSQAY